MVLMLLEGTTELPVMDSFGFTFLEGLDVSKQPPSPDKPRAFCGHLPFRFLPKDVVDKKVKVSVHMFDNNVSV
jgi:hypothetical protein